MARTRALTELAAGSGSAGSAGCPEICLSASVYSFFDAAGGYGLCHCGTTRVGCMCGVCYERGDGIVLATEKISGVCSSGAENCEGCVNWTYVPTATRVTRSRNATTSSPPPASTPTPVPSITSSPVAASTKEDSSGISTLSVVGIVAIVIVLGIIVGMAVFSYQRLNAPRRRRRRPVADENTTPEQEYVVVVVPVDDH